MEIQHTSLLLAEALHTLGCRCHDCDWRDEECFVELKSSEVAGADLRFRYFSPADLCAFRKRCANV